MKKNKKIIIAAVILVLACIAAWFLYERFMPAGEAGDKTITVTVVHTDKKEKEFTYQTDAAYLGKVLIKNELVEGEDGQYGMFITTVDKETADESKQQWWCITKAGEKVETSADQTPIKDGEKYELTLMEGY